MKRPRTCALFVLKRNTQAQVWGQPKRKWRLCPSVSHLSLLSCLVFFFPELHNTDRELSYSELMLLFDWLIGWSIIHHAGKTWKAKFHMAVVKLRAYYRFKRGIKDRPIQKNKSKCWICKKKIGILGFECRCGYTFCEDHRVMIFAALWIQLELDAVGLWLTWIVNLQWSNEWL